MVGAIMVEAAMSEPRMNVEGAGTRAPPRLVVIGHSHTETIAAAAGDQRVDLEMLNFWHLPDPFVTENGWLALKPAIRSRLIAPVFSLIGGAVHQDIGLVTHPRPFDFVWPACPDLPLTPDADIVPYDALHAIMLEQTAHYRDIMSAVRAAVTGPVFHMESPPTFEHEELPQDDPGFYHLFGADAAFSPAWLRFKLWRLHSSIIANHCGDIGIEFVPHPPEAVDARGFMLPAYHGTPAHANKAYGALVLNQMQEATAACAELYSAALANEDAQETAAPEAAGIAQDSVEGWVDGCEAGILRGWAWRAGEPSEKVILEVFADGILAAEGVAIDRRGDLAACGKGDGVCGFAIPVQAAPGALLEVRVRGGDALPGGPVPYAPAGGTAAPGNGVTLWPPLPWTLRHRVLGFIDAFGPDGIEGWAQTAGAPSAPALLELWDGAGCIARLSASSWRKDLEETRQGDGRWGLAAAMPARLRDGRVHRLHLRHADGSSVLDHHIIACMPKPDVAPLPAQAEPQAEEDKRPRIVRPPRAEAQDGLMFSVIVNFYNMAREAARTLTSLSRGYQRDIGALQYEVLCIDNYSDPALEPGWISSFGPEFRLFHPSRKLPSPVAAINEAAAQAQGKYIAVMIDGAHLLTPGVLREVWDAVTEAPDAVVGMRPWFVGGDQRWLAEAGYTRAHEDILFDKIAWPSDGYLLFREGVPFWESPRPWLDAMIESNCLFMPAWLYREIGGMADDFSEAGAGYANLDLFRRAVEASPEPPVALIGEATFHQFHDGTTTNVTVDMKEQRVRRYESHYVAIRGHAYPVTNAVDIRLRGQLRNLHAVASWQRPGMPSGVGVTERVRPGSLVLQFDDTAQTYLNSVYVENRLQDETRWRGQPLGMAPTDAMAIQDLVSRLRPGRIVVTNAPRGLLLFLDDLLRLLDLPASRIIAAGASVNAATAVGGSDGAGPEGVLPEHVVRIQGAARHAETIAAVEKAVSAEETILVIFAPEPGDTMPLEMLRAYAAFVTPRSYIVFLGTAFGQPWLGYSQHWYMTAIRRLLDSEPFAIDRSCNAHLVSTSPFGYLQRIEASANLAGPRPEDGNAGVLPDEEIDVG